MLMQTISLLLALLTAPLADKKPAVGNRALDFELTNFKGDKVSLAEQRGKVVLFDFWASWCGPCKEEMPYLDILQKTYGKAGFVVLAVNIDEQARNAIDFLERYQVKLMPLWDKDKQVVSTYDIDTMPTSIIIDRAGRIRYIHAGFKAEDFPQYKKEIEGLLRSKSAQTSRARPIPARKKVR